MKTLLLGIAMLTAAITACAQNNFSLKGMVPATFNGQKAYVALAGRNGAKLDSAVINKGSFKIKGITLPKEGNSSKLPFMARFFVGEGKQIACDFVLEDNPLTLTCEETPERIHAYVGGSKINDEKTAMTKDLDAVLVQLHKLQAERRTGELTNERKAEWEKEWSALDKKYDEIEQNYMMKNADNYLGYYYLQFRYYRLDLEKVKECFAKWSPEYKESNVGKKLSNWIERQELTKIGCPFTDFTMKNPEGKDVKISDYAGKGKYVFIDFWASWCGPCRAEIPNVIKAYNAYKDKGFEIVGVSLDDKEDQWKKAISELGLTWPQMSDLKGWNCEGAKLYGVNAIPATVLLGPDGKIVAKNLRGEEIEKKLAELLK